MTCEVCGDHGIVKVNWSNAPEDYGVCLCRVGQQWSVDENNVRKVAPMWILWCAWNQISPDRVVLLENVLTDEERREFGFTSQAESVNREAALMAQGKRAR